MTAILSWSALALTLAGGAFAALLAVRRVALGRDERRRSEAELRLRGTALALVEGEALPGGALGERDAQILAALVARYARQLKAGAREHVAAYFERAGGVARELEGLGDRRVWRRAAAAYALGDMGSATAAAPLVRALDDPEREVRAAAARSLGRLERTEAVEPLVKALAHGGLPRAVAGQALLAIGPAAIPALRRLEADAEAEVRASAVELVGLVGDASDAPLLVERLRDSSAEVRARSARALGRLGAAAAAAELVAALGDRIPFVRANAAHALGAVGDRAAGPALLEAARRDRFDPAQAAAHALMAVDPELLRAAAADPDAGDHVREAADLLAASAR